MSAMILLKTNMPEMNEPDLDLLFQKLREAVRTSNEKELKHLKMKIIESYKKT